MKGTILKSIGKLVVDNFGEEKWEECLLKNGFETDHVFLLRDDVEDEITMKMIFSLPNILGISLEQVIEAFGDYWTNVYSPAIYKQYYTQFPTFIDFVFGIPIIHKDITMNIPNAIPPSFEFTWLSKNQLNIKYISKRGLIDIAIALIKGLAKKYKEEIIIKKIDESNFLLEILNK